MYSFIKEMHTANNSTTSNVKYKGDNNLFSSSPIIELHPNGSSEEIPLAKNGEQQKEISTNKQLSKVALSLVDVKSGH